MQRSSIYIALKEALFSIMSDCVDFIHLQITYFLFEAIQKIMGNTLSTLMTVVFALMEAMNSIGGTRMTAERGNNRRILVVGMNVHIYNHGVVELQSDATTADLYGQSGLEQGETLLFDGNVLPFGDEPLADIGIGSETQLGVSPHNPSILFIKEMLVEAPSGLTTNSVWNRLQGKILFCKQHGFPSLIKKCAVSSLCGFGAINDDPDYEGDKSPMQIRCNDNQEITQLLVEGNYLHVHRVNLRALPTTIQRVFITGGAESIDLRGLQQHEHLRGITLSSNQIDDIDLRQLKGSHATYLTLFNNNLVKIDLNQLQGSKITTLSLARNDFEKHSIDLSKWKREEPMTKFTLIIEEDRIKQEGPTLERLKQALSVEIQ